MAWLGTYAKRTKVTVDNTPIDADLTHFAPAIVLGTSVGQSSQNMSRVFNELVYTDVDDDFTGTNGAPPNTDLWGLTGSPDIQSNQLHCSANNSTEQATAIFKFSGDFDIQIDFDDYTYTSGDVSARMKSWREDDPDYYMYLVRQRNASNNYIYTEQKTGGSASAQNITTVSAVSGKLRIKRVGTTITTYYDFSGSWTTSKATTNSGFSGNFIIAFSFEAGAGVGSVDWDNFTVNSGTVIWSENTNPNRKKIAITKTDGQTQIYGEIELWDSTNEKAVIHVSKSDLVLSSSGTTDLYIYYDSAQSNNDTYIGDVTETPAQNVWDSGYKGVYHFAQDPSGGTDCIKDSTSNVRHGTPYGSMTSADLVAGEIGKAIDLDGSDDGIDFGLFTVFDGLSALSVEAKVNLIQATKVEAILRVDNVIAFGVGWGAGSDQYLTNYLNDGSWAPTHGTSDIRGTGWEFCSARLFSGNSYVDVNGVNETNQAQGVPLNSPGTEVLVIGSGNSADYITGKLQEVRLSIDERSLAWMKATFYALKDDLLTYGTEELISSGGTDLVDMLLDIQAYNESTQNMRSDLIVATYATQNTKMSLQAYLQHVSDLKHDMVLYADSVQDMLHDAVIAGQITEDIKIDLSLLLESITNGKLDLKTWGDYTEDLLTDISAAFEVREDGKLDFSSAILGLQDFKNLIVLSRSVLDDAVLDLIIGDGGLLQDIKLDINIGDGNKVDDIGVHLVVVSTASIYKAIYGLHLESAIKEII